MTARIRMHGILIIEILVVLLITGETYAQTSKEKSSLSVRESPVPKIDGHGLYKFGMSIEQAKKARPAANKTDCAYVGTAYCLTENTKLFGQDATINVLFDKVTETLKQVNITFDRTEGKERGCRNVLQAIATPLIQKWGIPTREDGANWYWESIHGGTLSVLRLCPDDDWGIVVVSYKDTPSF